MQDSEKLSRDGVIALYQDDTMKLLRYEGWLQAASGRDASNIYKGEGIEANSMPVPVYDSTLLSFVKEAKATHFMNRNYVYTFSRYSLRSVQDELDMVERCTLMETDVLGDILSKYILKGEVRGAYWTEGVKNGIFLAILLRLKELLEIKKPLA